MLHFTVKDTGALEVAVALMSMWQTLNRFLLVAPATAFSMMPAEVAHTDVWYSLLLTFMLFTSVWEACTLSISASAILQDVTGVLPLWVQ